LVHLPAYIRRFGPAILFSTERYESFNHVFRLACIHSNRQGPSQDTCRVFAKQDIVKHIATGGYWFDTISKGWVRAGEAVLHYLGEHPAQARLLGIHTQESPVTGKVFIEYLSCVLVHNFLIQSKGTGCIKTGIDVDGQIAAPKAVRWAATRCAEVFKALELPQPTTDAQYYHGTSLVLSNGEKACLEGHVIFHNSSASHLAIGRVREILISSTNFRQHEVQHVVIQLFTFGDALHPSLHLPTLELTNCEAVIEPKVSFHDLRPVLITTLLI